MNVLTSPILKKKKKAKDIQLTLLVHTVALGSQSSFQPPCFSSQDKQLLSTHILIRLEMFAARGSQRSQIIHSQGPRGDFSKHSFQIFRAFYTRGGLFWGKPLQVSTSRVTRTDPTWLSPTLCRDVRRSAAGPCRLRSPPAPALERLRFQTPKAVEIKAGITDHPEGSQSKQAHS